MIHPVLVQQSGQGIPVGQFLQLLSLCQQLAQPEDQVHHPRKSQCINPQGKRGAALVRLHLRERLQPQKVHHVQPRTGNKNHKGREHSLGLYCSAAELPYQNENTIDS
ncbi:hypothetical protein D3C75_1214270 [compost metagenome]